MTRNRGLSAFSVVLLALIFGVIGGGAGAYYMLATQSPAGGAQPVAIPQPTDAGSGLQPATVQVSTEKDAIVNAVKRVKSAVVKVVGAREPRNLQEMLMSGGLIEGMGSGFIFEYEGRKLVLTNNHVIGDFTDLTLRLTDGRQLKARPLGYKRAEDLAVLEIIDPPNDLVAVNLGDSDKLQAGEWVIAVGNPFNFEHTVTVGVVSAIGVRQIGEQQRNVIQTDAAINSGNSGGPLLDLAGNVIGINFAIFDPQRNQVATTVGIGFAIPINQAKELMYFLVHRGPYLGLAHVMPNSEGLARYLGLRTDKGFVVRVLYRDSPAVKAGMEINDVVLKVNGQELADLDALQKVIFKHKIGDTIAFTVQRGAKQLEIPIVAGTAPEDMYF